ncbi:MAG: hypothetical protein LBJ08_11205 [Bifidobacteriaceae bacterium]|jgi:alpha-N-arabinofuranosidase|nr:hypothetical protein [Bifidobacteriaceae bacterium]
MRTLADFVDAAGMFHEVGLGEARYLASAVAGGFTGVYFGMYAVSGLGVPAYWNWFECVGELRNVE